MLQTILLCNTDIYNSSTLIVRTKYTKTDNLNIRTYKGFCIFCILALFYMNCMKNCN